MEHSIFEVGFVFYIFHVLKVCWVLLVSLSNIAQNKILINKRCGKQKLNSRKMENKESNNSKYSTDIFGK
jgi:hypothetical protein